MSDLFAWLISFLFLVSLLIIVVYQLVCLSDLEFDYVNPYDSSIRINRVVIPEFTVQGALTIFYLLTGHWFMAILSLPYLCYNIKLYTSKEHLTDVTEIYNSLKREQKRRLFKLGHIALFLFITTFWLIHSALEDD
ncbi:PREDICTED: protein cornichon homolog 5 [Tarenaya hassleriana]|uniref:protein cornichon homolog 5 n=1 Tax=Tarenaya hassleriana TaxID=28532 RepID=UPI00053C5AE0|nr:PREDICTED: protein cornichon homolog 5 [Tarenaya hassleriana]